MNKSHDLQNVVSFHEDTTENKTEGSATTETSEIVKNDQAAEEAVEDIKERLEEQKINEELKDPEKTATEHNSGVVTVTDSNSKKDNKKDNKEDIEQKVEEPFEAGEDLTSSEAQTKDTTDDEDKTSSTTAPVTTTPVDLFSNEIIETTETVEETQENSYEMSVITKEENEVVVENTTTLKEETTVEEKTETAEVAAVINNSYVVADKNETATIVVDAGTIVSADAGEGVIVNISGNTIMVALETAEQTMVDVDLVDSMGNIVTAVVSFK